MVFKQFEGELTVTEMWKALEEMGLEQGDRIKNSVLDILDLICLLDIKRGA